MNEVIHSGRRTRTINLIREEELTRRVGSCGLHVPTEPDSAMTMDDLKRNYLSLIRSQAVFYPVAYQIVRQIGSGRQGTILFVLRPGARGCTTEHAIKVFDSALYRSVQEYWTDMGRIAFQVCQLHRLQSPNLVSTSFYEETDGIGYIQMEAIDGLDLRLLMTKESLDFARSRSTPQEWERFTTMIFRINGSDISLQPGVAVYILRSVLRGLERVHTLNFLHYDIKPANIMIDRLGDVKLVDFGRAVVVGESLSFLLGSPMYMAPETHRREPGSIQSDYYSLGLVAIEMLRGKRLVENEDMGEEELFKLKMNLEAELPDILPPHVRENRTLVRILRKFLAPYPTMRFASAREAEAGEEGLKIISNQLVQAGLDAEYERELSDYISKFVDPRDQRVMSRILRIDTSARQANTVIARPVLTQDTMPSATDQRTW